MLRSLQEADKMSMLLSIIALFAFSQAAPQDLHFYPKAPLSYFDDVWAAYKVQYGKTYESLVEDYRRQTIFAENLKIIESHNYLFDMGLKTYRLGLNQLTDMNSSEVIQQMTGYNKDMDSTEEGTTYLSPSGVVLPDTVDWRDEGYVTPVKNQGSCGSCWSFSTTGSLEGQTKKKTGNLVSLSEQNLVDCSKAQGNYGCQGGLMSNAFKYIKGNGGLDTEESYPYEGKDLECRYKEQSKGATVTGYVNIQKGSEEKLQEAVATVGPVSVGINVQPSFMSYHSGIYYDKNCEPTHLRHAVLVVGYGTERGLDYWLVKNSWGTSWGEKGYIRMARNKDNHCGIASDGIYPLV